jgi:hypothetical protein
MDSERTPLLGSQEWFQDGTGEDPHTQFCMLVGVPPSNLPPGAKAPRAGPTTLYKRATRDRSHQNVTYTLTAALSNTLLLTQVILGATLTALGASESSHILITIFGVLNTVIAGLVAYLKSRGQPMRARMYRDDMERVVDEIENSEVMWLGISRGVHGYNQINTDDEVTVRSEVARLTRLYDRAVRTNTMNNPDMYMAGQFDSTQTGLRKIVAPAPAVNIPTPAPVAAAIPDTSASSAAAPATPAAPVVVEDPDESPASAPPKPKPKAAPAPVDPRDESNNPSSEAPAKDADATKLGESASIGDTKPTDKPAQPSSKAAPLGVDDSPASKP